jgi:hypothetical protein
MPRRLVRRFLRAAGPRRDGVVSIRGVANVKIRSPMVCFNCVESNSGFIFLVEHDLIRKPVSTFRDHALDQPQTFQAGMAILADDDVVVHGNAERRGDIDDSLSHLDVRLRWRWITTWMVVQLSSPAT